MMRAKSACTCGRKKRIFFRFRM